MGLTAHILQTHRSVRITVRGEIRQPELYQIEAILNHYVHRGCNQFQLDFTGAVVRQQAIRKGLRRMTGGHLLGSGLIAAAKERVSAVRLLADSLTARPQPGREGYPS